MAAPSKPRWYQFSLLRLFTVITVVALTMAWTNHQSYCHRQWSYHVQANDGVVLGYKPLAQRSPRDSQVWLQEMRRIDEWHEYHNRMAEAYRRATWQPWLRFWIDETPPEPSP
jgi:hypothetical protein